MLQFYRLSQERFDNIKVNFSGWKSSLRYWNRCVRYFLLHWEDDTAWPETWVRGWRVDTCGHNLSPDSRNGYNLEAGNYRRNIGGDIGANCAPRDGSWLRESIVTAGRGSRWPHHLFLKRPVFQILPSSSSAQVDPPDSNICVDFYESVLIHLTGEQMGLETDQFNNKATVSPFSPPHCHVDDDDDPHKHQLDGHG